MRIGVVLESEMGRVDVYVRARRDREKMGDDGAEKECEVVWGGVSGVGREEGLNWVVLRSGITPNFISMVKDRIVGCVVLVNGMKRSYWSETGWPAVGFCFSSRCSSSFTENGTRLQVYGWFSSSVALDSGF